MNEILKEKLSRLMEDDLMVKALKAAFAERIERERPKTGEISDNALLGEKYRAYDQARAIIESSFNDLNNYKIGNKPPEKFNRAV